jgi:hypothetical protein
MLTSQDLRAEASGIWPENAWNVACLALQATLKDSPMYILRALAFLFSLAQVVLTEQPDRFFLIRS